MASWSLSANVEDAAAVAALQLSGVNYQDAETEILEQFEIAKAAVADLITSGAIGVDSPSRQYQIQLSGQANPLHEPRAGQGNDSINLSIFQITG
jgi:hypothetical protein